MPPNVARLAALASQADRFQGALGELAGADKRVRAASSALTRKRTEFITKKLCRLLREQDPTAGGTPDADHDPAAKEAEEEASLKPLRETLTQAEADQERIRCQLKELAASLINRVNAAAAEVKIQDTAAITNLQKAWSSWDQREASAVASEIAIRARWVIARHGHPLPTVMHLLNCLKRLADVEGEWWKLTVSPLPPRLPHEPRPGRIVTSTPGTVTAWVLPAGE